MILHLIEDDHFCPYAIRQFTTCSEDNNKFLLVIPASDYKLKFIKDLNKTLVLVENSVEYQTFIKNLNQYNAIISHNLLTSWKAEVIREAPDSTKIAWVFWGSELYSRRGFTLQFLGPATRKIYQGYIFKQKLKKLLYRLFTKKKYSLHYEVPKDVFNKVSYCLTDVNEDAIEAEKYFNTNFSSLWYNYYSIEETVGSLLPDTCTGPNILLGNSASITNNHHEVIKLLSAIPLEGRKVIVPLSYGDNYIIPVVKKYAHRLLDDKFHPVETYVAREEYNRMIKDCTIAIFNHYRPQALGNIVTSLWLGARVYLSKRSLLYDYFTKIGIILFNVEEHLTPENSEALSRLPIETIRHNRGILNAVYGRDSMLSKVQQVMNILEKK